MENLFMIRRAEEELDAEDVSVQVLCDLIGMAPPKLWPPLSMGADERAWTRAKLLEDSENVEWVPQYVAVRIGDTNHLVGAAGYKGKPGADRSVEISYAISLEHQQQGYGTAAVHLALRFAFMSPDVDVVKAKISPSLTSGVRVLEKNGFNLVDQSVDPAEGRILHYAIDRATFQDLRAKRLA